MASWGNEEPSRVLARRRDLTNTSDQDRAKQPARHDEFRCRSLDQDERREETDPGAQGEPRRRPGPPSPHVPTPMVLVQKAATARTGRHCADVMRNVSAVARRITMTGILYDKTNIPLAVVEAKDERGGPSGSARP